MDKVYEIMEVVLPFSWMEYSFMKNSFLAIIIISPLFGMLGTMIVNNKMAFFSDALGHSALTGVAIGALLGVMNVNIITTVFGAVFALLLNRIKRRSSMSTDTVISAFSSFVIAIGLMILSRGGDFAKYSGLLVGDILSISIGDIGALLVIFIITIIFWLFGFNKLNAVGVNKSLARSKNINCNLMEDLFSVLIAIIVMFSIKWIGVLIINALLILPAASSRNISSNVREYNLFAIIISLFSGVAGLIVSYYIGTATGPSIVIFASGIFFLTLIINPKRLYNL